MAAGTSVFRRAALQVEGGAVPLVAKGSFQDWGIIISGFVDPLVLSANDANGYAITAVNQGTGGVQTMAGGIDFLRVNANGSGTAGGGFIERWANGQITNPTGQYAGGDLYLGAASLHVTSSGLTIDAPLYALNSGSPAIVSGGTGWTTNEWATDGYGNWGYVTASGGAVTALTVTVFGNQPTAYNGTVTWTADSVSGIQTAGGGNLPGTGLTVAESWSQLATPTIGIGTGAATAINIGNSGSTTTLAGILKGAPGTFTANGSTATTMTSLGPPGAHTTVQEWLTVTDATGNVPIHPVLLGA